MKSPAFQFYPAEYLADEDVQLLTLQQEGAYIRAMSYCWREGSIPADPERLSRLLSKGCTIEDSQAIASLFAPHKRDSSRLIHLRLEKERLKQEKFRKSMSDSGKKGATKRWDSIKRPKPSHSQAIATPMASDSSSSSSSSSINKKKNTPSDKREVRKYVWLSEKQIDDYIAKYGKELLAKFSDKLSAYIESDPSPKKIRNGKNAEATFRSWVIKAVENEMKPPPQIIGSKFQHPPPRAPIPAFIEPPKVNRERTPEELERNRLRVQSLLSGISK